ncbi:Bifunctional heparan sulfate N-deacetylase/N-sulfotransferase-like [Oopsacas minuta]|uniref:Bifunctional heparan sulfate N-deacetylase/N-sulfotransferase-like n=1 Tax=Oopsacas minuta TaxID=111878 RepID=A0AAV7K906_9METZ|nr:Bifunctional heparan sulfate N-deacetylase/N-sulfotransferase-like [Oopsacas minuta]
MTHFSNFAGDNLAQIMFEELITFVQRWPQIKLVYRSQLQLADIYFKTFPGDIIPLWNLPCNSLLNSRHADIYSGDIACQRTPRILLVGPQKTGSTALLSFLVNLPEFSTSYKDPDSFEEIQFFSNSSGCLFGIDWYQSRFPLPTNTILIEKSATYFDHKMCPQRIHTLLPNSHIVIILRDPVERVYSWFQHQRVHRNILAQNYSFIDILQNNFMNKLTR